jgi:hypothetical protein
VIPSQSWVDIIDSDSETSNDVEVKKPIDPKRALVQKYAPLKLALYNHEDLQYQSRNHVVMELIERRYARQLPDKARKHLEKVVLKRVFQTINAQMCKHYSALDVFGFSTNKEFNCKLITINEYNEVEKYAKIFKFPADTIPKLQTMIDVVEALIMYDAAGTVCVNGSQYCFRFE